ncbi:MAG: DUF4340 domain-containing protein [Sandaracinaceae bacterium]|nr:DUF4340 domain-containing protein [Sandaracinaceae bacterium]
MDEIKRYRLLIGGVVLLGMIGLAWWAIRARTGDTAPAEGAAAPPTVPEIDRDAITEIEIRRPEDDAAIRLVKDGETWRLAAPVEAPAASSNVDTALDKLADLDVRGVASSNPQFHERLEVDEEHGVHVIARAGGETLIDIGSAPSAAATPWSAWRARTACSWCAARSSSRSTSRSATGGTARSSTSSPTPCAR